MLTPAISIFILSGVFAAVPEVFFPSAEDSATFFEPEERRPIVDEALTLGRSQSIKNIFILHCTAKR